jgi:hypothetical protein
MRVIADMPIAYWRMDEMSEGSVVDNSGFGRHLDYTGIVDILNPPLIAGGQSKYFDTTDYASTTIGGFLVNGREANGFSLEAWVRTDGTPSTERLILGRANDGVFVVQDGFEFRLVSSDGITYKVKYTVATWERTYHVVATFSGGQMSLYVNGEYGDSTPFFGEFTNTSNTFYVGGTGTTGPSMYIDEVAVYQAAMPPNAIGVHYSWGVYKTPYRDFITAEGGTYWGLDTPSATKGFEFSDDFSTGTLTNLTVDDGRIYLTDRASAGSRVTLPMDIGELSAIAGSRIDWAATNTGITVDVSTNVGATWTPLTNHAEIAGIASGSTAKFVQFRINFPANNAGVLDKLHAVVYLSKNSRSINSSALAAASGAVTLSEFSYDAMNEPLLGATLSGGTITIPAAETQNTVQSIDFWVRRDSGMPAMPNVTPTQTVVNGVVKTPVAGDFITNEWTHVGITLAPSSSPIVFTTGSGLAHVATYNYVLTPEQFARHYEIGFGKNYGTVLDRSRGIITEPTPLTDAQRQTYLDAAQPVPPTLRAYLYNWQVFTGS